MKKSLFFLAALVILLVVFTHILQRKMDVLLKDRSSPLPAGSLPRADVENAVPSPSRSFRKHDLAMVRRDRLSPGRDYMESVFYAQDTEIAWQKIVDGKVVEAGGTIPNGKVKVVNESNNMRGVEHYSNGKKDGPSNIYYPDGQMFEEAYYRHGQLLWKKEYYSDGNLRLEIDYQDARDYGDEVEVGRGKLYYKDGTVKYEWQLTNSDEEGFKRSYDQKGGLRGALYFDRDGHLIE